MSIVAMILVANNENINSSKIWQYFQEVMQGSETIETRPTEPITASREVLIGYLKEIAIKYGQDYEKMYNTVQGESNFDPNAISKDGGSIGIAEFTEPTWNQYCLKFGNYKDADPFQQLDCMGYMWSKNLQYRWDAYCFQYRDIKCIKYRNLYPL